jgi:hypothetical protein
LCKVGDLMHLWEELHAAGEVSAPREEA